MDRKREGDQVSPPNCPSTGGEEPPGFAFCSAQCLSPESYKDDLSSTISFRSTSGLDISKSAENNSYASVLSAEQRLVFFKLQKEAMSFMISLSGACR